MMSELQVDSYKPGFIGLAKLIWLSTVSKDQVAMYKAATKLEAYIADKIKGKTDPYAIADFRKLAMYGMYITVLLQNSGHFKEAAKFAVNFKELSDSAIVSNPNIKPDRSNAAIEHAGAWSAAMTYHHHQDELNPNKWLDIAKLLHDSSFVLYKQFEGSDTRQAALAGTLAFIKFSQGDLEFAESLLTSAEALKKGQMAKELSNNWPKSDKEISFKRWDDLVLGQVILNDSRAVFQLKK